MGLHVRRENISNTILEMERVRGRGREVRFLKSLELVQGQY